MKQPTGLLTLIRNSAAGDAQSKADLYELTKQPLYRHIINQFGTILREEDAWEVTDQAIMIIYIHASNFEGEHGESSAWKWAYTIARTQALKRIKVLRRYIPVWQAAPKNLQDADESTQLDALFQQMSSFSIDESLEEQALNHLILESAKECLQELNEREKQILFMRYADNCTLDEIAERYQIKRPRVHQILTAIHAKLRKRAKIDTTK